jgi:DNA-binding response OmpR family regulator
MNDKLGRLLIVEDDVSLTELMHEHLKVFFEIAIAHDGETGYELACTFRPDCILSDVRMPKLSGINLLRKIRLTPGLETVGVILLTVLNDEEDRIRGFRSLADLYFSKPFNMDEVTAATIGLVNIRKKIQASLPQTETTDVILPIEKAVSDEDANLLRRLSDFVEEHMADFQLSVERVARGAHLSKRSLERKLKSLEGISPAEYIRQVRLEEAKKLLDAGVVHNIKELAFRVGFKDPEVLSKRFKEHFGFSPSTRLISKNSK